MGVPAFFRWLTEKYPKLLVDVLESHEPDLNVSSPNPDPSFETDNLYIDMNGIIHPACFSNNDSNQTTLTEVEMLNNLTSYVERLVKAVRPRKVLYLAIDGVAPRAKMNQQRSRRFRSAEEKRMLAEIEEQCRQKLSTDDDDNDDDSNNEASPNKDEFDRNVITPGTDFMMNVSAHVQKWLKKKAKEWKIAVIFSDASIPGEGEHKIMDYVRAQRGSPGYDPNTRHVIHGLDADLIMLALATHEPHFTVLREEVILGKSGSHMSQERKRLSRFKETFDELNNGNEVPTGWPYTEPLVRLSVPCLREYLMIEFEQLRQYPWFDFERLVDDVVFMTFFIGNDFLPHLPSLEIREGALDFLFNVYKEIFPRLQGYITSHGGDVDLAKLNTMLIEIGKIEDMVFQNRYQSEIKRMKNQERWKAEKEQKASQNNSDDGTKKEGKSARALKVKHKLTDDEKKEDGVANKKMKKDYKVKSIVNVPKKEVDVKKQKAEELKEIVEKKHKEILDENASSIVDKIRLHESGWKDRYYSDKIKSDDIESAGGKQHLFRSYLIGLCWVSKYYFTGVPSWKWFFPFHYSPFASDLRNVHYYFTNHPVTFQINEPFDPIEQLMAVLPEDSSRAVPESCRWLMADVESPIFDFYPKQVPVDPNGKKYPWLWVVLLPFIDEDRLIAALSPTKKDWTKTEKKRNVKYDAGNAILFLTSKLSKSFQIPSKIDVEGYKLKGFVQGTVTSVVKHSSKDDQEEAAKLKFHFKLPNAKKHKSVLLKGLVFPTAQLTQSDRYIRRPKMNQFSIANLGISNRSYNNPNGKAPTQNFNPNQMLNPTYEWNSVKNSNAGNQHPTGQNRSNSNYEAYQTQRKNTGPNANNFQQRGGHSQRAQGNSYNSNHQGHNYQNYNNRNSNPSSQFAFNGNGQRRQDGVNSNAQAAAVNPETLSSLRDQLLKTMKENKKT